MDAERADRISRLAGLERVATARQGGLANPAAATSSGGTYLQPSGHVMHGGTPGGTGYFDASAGSNPYHKERSTVGSASATTAEGGGSTTASGRVATWATSGSLSDAADEHMSAPDGSSTSVVDDEMMLDEEDEGLSMAGMSDDASLVGFGEAAGTGASTVGGYIPGGGSTSRLPGGGPQRVNSGFSGINSSGATEPMQGLQAARNANMTGQETAERIVRERVAKASHGKGQPIERDT